MRVFITALFALVAFSGCMRVDPQEVVARVHELGDDRGEIEIFNVPGKYGPAMWWATNYYFPTTEQNYRWTRDDQESYGSEGDESIRLQISKNNCWVEAGVRFYVDDKNEEGLRKLVSAYPTSLDGVVDKLLYEKVRTAFKSAVIGKELNSVMDSITLIFQGPVTEMVRKDLKEYGIEIAEVYEISGLNVPDGVKDRLQATQIAQQQVEEREQKRNAELVANQITLDRARADSAAAVIRAQAEAEANRIRNANPPSAAVLRQMLYEKWDGKEAPGENVILLREQ